MMFSFKIKHNTLEELVHNKTEQINKKYPYNSKGIEKRKKDIGYLKLNNYLILEHENIAYEKNKKLQKIGFIATLMKGF